VIFFIATAGLYVYLKNNINGDSGNFQNTILAGFIGFTIFAIIVIALLGFYFNQYFFKPLNKIATAMSNDNSSSLQNISTKNTDLGRVAQKIKLYLSQKEAFQEEIKNRKQTETELKQALLETEKATLDKARAENATGAKSEFLSTMSHEIRTPLNGLIGVVNLLKEETLTTRQKEYVDILSYSSKHLVALVSDILDFTKIEEGKVGLDKSSFNLNSVCEAVHHLYKITAENKSIQFKYIPDEVVSYSIYGDSVRLNQILTNLVGNAIKFTQKGCVTFSYKQIAKSDKSCTIEFVIEDTGIGIAENEQAQIFNVFSQANNKIASTFGGTGLGLAICKKLIELKGGTLKMNSVLGKGTVFSFCLSFETSPYQTLPEVTQTNFLNTETLQGMKVLVAEDNNINILVLKRFLEKWGVLTTVVLNGKDALEAIEQQQFDLVLMDIHMPVMNGEEATKIIRANSNTTISQLPVVALTATASVDAQQSLLASGFTNYISKPFNPESLFRLLKKYY